MKNRKKILLVWQQRVDFFKYEIYEFFTILLYQFAKKKYTIKLKTHW